MMMVAPTERVVVPLVNPDQGYPILDLFLELGVEHQASNLPAVIELGNKVLEFAGEC
jgi:hypothetical protein